MDRSKAPEKDFVLYFRGFENAFTEPVCIVKRGDGIQSVFLQIIPDRLNAHERIKAIKAKLANGDTNSNSIEEQKS